MADQDFYSNSEFQQAAMGWNGARKWVNADGTTPAGHVFCAIQALEDSTVTATETPAHPNGDASLSETLLAGTIIMGVFTAVACPTGRVRLYYADNKTP